MVYEGLAEIRGGVLRMRDRQRFESTFAGWSDGVVVVRVDSANIFRSPAQNKLWHAAIVAPLAAHCGVTPRQMHEALKVHLLPEVVTIPNVATITIGGSTTQLTRHEAGNLIDRAINVGRAAGIDLGVVQAAITHFVPFDAPPIGRNAARAICGALVPVSLHAVEPSCEVCAAALAEDDRSVARLNE
jgi:hypothetical protein